MICPRCHGIGYWRNWPSMDPELWMPCTYPGCHNGQIHCCEGDKAGPIEFPGPEQGTTSEDR